MPGNDGGSFPHRTEMVKLKPKEISEIEGVDMVLGANEKFNLPQLLSNLDKVKTT